MNRLTHLIIIFSLLWGPVVANAATEDKVMQVDETMVKQWNIFSDKVLALHKKILGATAHRKEIRSGGYTGYYFNRPDFYIEETYFAEDDGRLLSRVKWEKANPGNLHVLEVYIYDESRVLVRDYLVAYLPWGRNAPIQALVNFHTRAADVQGFRQFDASGVRVYEQCSGQIDGKKISISLESHEIESPRIDQKDYRHCFSGLPTKAGIYLDPR